MYKKEDAVCAAAWLAVGRKSVEEYGDTVDDIIRKAVVGATGKTIGAAVDAAIGYTGWGSVDVSVRAAVENINAAVQDAAENFRVIIFDATEDVAKGK